MKSLIALLLQVGGDMIVRRTARHMAGAAALYGVIVVLALSGFVFLYMFLYSWLARMLDAPSAAAILCGANLLAIAGILFARWLSGRRRRPRAAPGGADALLRSLMGGESPLDGDLESALAIGVEAGQRLRKAAPQIALAAGLIGIILGARPEILEVFGARRRPRR
ncbi:MAG TPA: hypothetical protein VL899_04245 [Alphaproteobacteria bacterium]|nr:hypothetical protein [Alphaproteobacteria bacterium]